MSCNLCIPEQISTALTKARSVYKVVVNDTFAIPALESSIKQLKI